MQFAAGLLLSIALAGITPAVLAAPSDLEGRQSDAEKQQAALRERIEALQKAIDTRESVRKEAADALRASESSISGINRRLRELATDSRQAQTDLSSLERQVSAQQVVLDKRRSELADQLRTQYASGLSPWAALLSGNDPQELGRNLSYLDYVSQARARNVEVLRKDIDRLAALQERADGRRVELEKVVAEITEQKNSLLVQQKERATLLAQLEGQIAAQRAEAGKLGRDDQRLSRLIDDLDVAIAKQAEAARKAEQERQAALAAQRKAEEARKIEEARLALAARKRAEAERQKAELAAKRSRDEADAAQARAQVEAAARQAQGPVVLADPDAAGLRPLAPGQNSLIGGQQVKEATPPPEVSGKAAQSSKAIEEEAEQTRSRVGAEPPPRPAVNTGNGLRHGLPMPVRGAVQGRFGVDRPDGGVWRGIVLRTAEGTPVKAVAPGAVVYSDWLRGFGNLIIVDHGQQYLTVYA